MSACRPLTDRRGSVGVRHALALLLACLLLVAAARPNDPLVPQQAHLETVGAFQAWDVRRGEDAVVAVLDTGVDLDHPDLTGRLVEGIDLVQPDSPPDDPQGHGTIVAGIIAAVADNGRGVAGVAPQARIMPIRVLDAQGRGTSDVVAAGIRHAIEQQVTVINLSLAEVKTEEGPLELSLVSNRDVQDAIREASEAGIMVVAAAGNDGDFSTPYAYDSPVVVVGATDAEDVVWEQSNRDDRTLFAPGVGILSTWHEGRYAKADGTSFATPIVAAGAAMLMGSGLTLEEARDRLVSTAVNVREGLGRVDLGAAMVGVQPAPTPTTTPIPPPPPTTPPATSQPAPTASGSVDGVEQVEPVQEVTVPAATVTTPPPAIVTGPVQTLPPTEPGPLEPVEMVEEVRAIPTTTPTPVAAPLEVQDDGAAATRRTAIPVATALLGADLLAVGWLVTRRRG